MIADLSERTSKILPLIGVGSAVVAIVTAVMAFFTLHGWEGVSPSQRLKHVELKIDSATVLTNTRIDSVIINTDVRFARMESRDSVFEAQRVEAQQQLEFAILLLCNLNQYGTEPLAQARCNQILRRWRN